MVRKMCVLLMMLLFCVPVQAGVSSWIWADSDAIGTRIGTDLADNIEVGISALWWPDSESPEIYGIYGVYTLPECIQLPNPIVLDFLPETIGGCPYFGGKVDVDFSRNKGSASLIAGIVFEKILFLEYQFQSFDRQNTTNGDSKLIFGIKFKW